MSNHPRLSLLTSEEESLIYEKCIHLLSTKGVKIDYPKAVDIFKKAGAEADDSKGMIRFRRSTIEEALKTAPSSFVVRGGEEKYDFALPHPDGSFYTSTCVQSMLYHDPDTNRFVDVTGESLAEWTRLAHSLPNIHKIAMQTPTDAPKATADVHSLNIHLQNTTKPLMILAYRSETVEYLFDLMLARAGSAEALADRPLLLTYPTSFSPLQFKPMDLETIFSSCRYGVPVVANSLAISGATGPMTVAGTVLLAAVEILAMIVMTQLLKPGSPVIASVYTTSMDMATGNALLGNADSLLGRATATQFIKSKFDVPVETFSFMTDSYLTDGQAVMEKVLTPTVLDLAGSDIQYGCGRLGGATCASPIQLIIDDQLYSIIRRCNGPIDISEETLAVRELLDIEPGGNFLTSEHTLLHCRDSIRPELFAADTLDMWREKGSKSLYDRAVDKYRELRGRLEAPEIPEDVKKDMEGVVRRADRMVAGK